MKVTATIIDYGMGNLFSVNRAVEKCGAEAVLTDTAAGIDAAKWLILPGVGAFADGMEGLRSRGLIEPLRRYAASQRPLLGICLGMQMMLEVGYEFGTHEGLGLIPGRVEAVPTVSPSGSHHKVPHIGWNFLKLPAGRTDWQGTNLRNTPVGSATYFVHSFMAVPDDPGNRLADVDYDGVTICASVCNGRVVGHQFHPEKSSDVGLAILGTFLEHEPS
jgi:glutamine amidotransferase